MRPARDVPPVDQDSPSTEAHGCVVLLDRDEAMRPIEAVLARAFGGQVSVETGRWEDLNQHDAEEPTCAVVLTGRRRDSEQVPRAVEEADLSSSIALLSVGGIDLSDTSPTEHAAVQLLRWPTSATRLQAVVLKGLERSATVRKLRISFATLEVRLAAISPREQEVLRLIRQGHPSKSVARILGISKRTVDEHRRALIHKSGSGSISEVIHAFGQLELLDARLAALLRGPWRPARSPRVLLSHSLAPLHAARPPAVTRPPTSREGQPLGEAIERSETSSDSVCFLDPELRLVWTNPVWQQFAPSGPMRDRIVGEWSLGASYVASIAALLRDWFERHLVACLEDGEAWQHDYACPTPEDDVLWRLTARRTAGLLWLRHQRLRTRPHEPANGAGDTCDDGQEVHTQCMECRRSRLGHPASWQLLADHIAQVPKLTRWSLCPACAPAFASSEARGR